MLPFISSSRLLIFDLDGTLYEDTAHFDYYANLLMQRVGAKSSFYEEYEKMKQGKHPVNVGKGYNVEHDCIVTIDPMDFALLAVEDWDGTKWDERKQREVFGDKVTFDFEHTIAIGDGWWLPYVTALHYGLSREEAYFCYQETKEFMITDEFKLKKTPGLLEGLQQLKRNKVLVLVSNSDEQDVSRLLKELGLENIFAEIIPSAQKPAYTAKRFTYLLDKYQCAPEEAVSIGDNFINDIAPALRLGMKTILIHNTPLEKRENFHQVTTLANAFLD